MLIDAGNVFLKGGEGIIAGLKSFDRERSNIEFAQLWAKSQIEIDKTAANLTKLFIGPSRLSELKEKMD